MSYNIYLITTEYFGKKVYKIGRTKRPIEKRLNELRTSNANPLEVLFVYKTNWGTQVERRLHTNFRKKRMEGEWFNLTEEDVKNFTNLCKEYSDMYQMLYDENPFFKKYIKS
jgi:hypothetical protein